MFKCSHFVLIVISGLLWTAVGVLLMTLGLHHMMDALRLWDEIILSSHFSLYKYLSLVVKGPEQAMAALIITSILVGYFKGHFVLSRSVKRGVDKILTYPNPMIKNIYSKKYYLLIAFMMGLGMFLRWLKLSSDLHGAIDLAIGSALLKGALNYYRYAWAEKKGTLIHDK